MQTRLCTVSGSVATSLCASWRSPYAGSSSSAWSSGTCTGSFVELIKGLSRVRAVLVDDGDGHRYLTRDEIPAASMAAFRALNLVPPRWVERLD